MSDYSEEYSHWNAVESLGDWLKREKIPGITGIDTRALTKKIREHGVMMGRIVIGTADKEGESGGEIPVTVASIMWIVFLAKTLSPTYLTGSPPITL